MKTFRDFLLGVALAFLVLIALSVAIAMTGCVHTEIDLPNVGHYSNTAVLATRQARSIDVKLGADKGVKVSGYGQDSTEVAKQALATAQAALEKAP